MGDHASLSSFQKYLRIPINIQEESGLVTFEALNSTSLSRCQEMWGPLFRWGGELGFSLGSPQRNQTSLHLERWKTNLHSSHIMEIPPYFQSGNLGIHSTWGCKIRVPLIYLLLRKSSFELLVESWLTCSIESWESALFLRQYGVHGSFIEFLCWNWCSYKLKTCVSGNFCIFLKKSSHMSCMMGNRELFCSQCRGIGLNLVLIWTTLR